MHSPLHVLFIIDELDIGGTEQQLFELVKRLNRRKYMPLVCCFRPGRLSKEIEALDIPVFTFRKKAKFDPGLILSLIRLIRRERIDLVQTYLFTANTWARLAAILAGTPIIVSSERNVNMWEERYKRIFGRALDYWTHATIANSAAVKEYLVSKGIALRKIHVINNGVDPERFTTQLPPEVTKAELGIPPSHRVVGLMARLEPAKDVHTFLRAAAIIVRQTNKVSFLIVGGGSLQPDLEREAQQLGIADHVIFTGPRRDIPHLLAACDLSVLSSLKEGMSNTIMESMATGKPIVATNVGGNAELIVEGETGFLVPTRNPAALAAAVQQLLDDPARAQRMGKQAQIRITQLFSAQSLAARTERLYDELVKSRQGARPSTRHSSIAPQKGPSTAFVVSQFPRYVDAYFLREVTALAERGLHFQIFSLLNFKGKVVHSDAQALLPRTFYIPFFFSWKLWQAQMHFLLHTPRRYFAALWLILRGSWRRPRLLLRSLAVFPKSVYFAKVVQDHEVAHVHANWASHPAASALVISRLTGTPWSFSGHASDIYIDTTMLAEKVHAAEFVVTCTRHNKDYLTEVAGPEASKKIIVSYHGVDLQKFIPAPKHPSERFQILAVGTLLPCKGLPDLIEACRLLAERGVAFDCTIAGDGPERRLLEQQIHRYSLNDRVKILGYVAQETLIPLYQQAGVVALPALSESHFGIPNVLLEAMAVKTPVICTPLPSLSEVMEDGQQGIYIPEHDPKALADAMEKLARTPALCRDLGESGRRKIEELFDTEKNVGTLEELFRLSSSVKRSENMVTIDAIIEHAEA